MCVLMARMSVGKSCVNTPIDYLLADIEERDKESRRREREWSEEVSRKGANKEKPKRPDDLCIQLVQSDMTNAAFVRRLEDANGNFIYTRMDEVELLDQLKTNNKGQQVSQILRLAFDCGWYGQERVGPQSVTGRVRVKWNWNASSTIQKGKRYFRNALADGTLSRLNFCTIMADTDSDIPVIGTYDNSFAAELKPYVDNLNGASGIITCPEAEELARQLMVENRDIANLSDDEVNRIAKHVKEVNPSTFDPDILERLDQLANDSAEGGGADIIINSSDMSGGDGGLFEQAVEFAIQDGQISTSTLQRRLKIGYARAGRLTDEMEERGIVAAKDGSKPRKCLITREEWEEMKNSGE